MKNIKFNCNMVDVDSFHLRKRLTNNTFWVVIQYNNKDSIEEYSINLTKDDAHDMIAWLNNYIKES